ncbi:MAG TPA: molybdenum ABC transporter ATP-binding protein [Terriglobales bacterium]
MEVNHAHPTRAASEARSGVPQLSVSVRKSYGEGFQLDVDFFVQAGITILFGASGAGKTTLLNSIAGLAQPDEGRISAGNSVLFDSSTRVNLPVSRRRVGYVFQDLALFPHLSVEKNVMYGLSHMAVADRQARVNEILESFHIPHLQQRKPAAISGGERQRVALARALVTDPCVLLLDEPLAALDGPTKSKLVDDLRLWNQVHRIPILYVTHTRDEVFALGDSVLVLEGGKIIAQGAPHDVMRAPRQESVAQLAGFENIFDARVIAQHEDRGTMTCELGGGAVQVETPLVKASTGSRVRVGISAGDILLATDQPTGLSARNILPGRMVSLERRDVIVSAKVDCGVEMEVHLTLAARDSLHLEPGRNVWLIVKTHSCHLLAGTGG